jgi:hypothetical protein
MGLYLQVQTSGVDAEAGKTLTFYPGLYVFADADRRCGRRPENMTFYPGLYFAGADNRRGRSDRKKT